MSLLASVSENVAVSPRRAVIASRHNRAPAGVVVGVGDGVGAGEEGNVVVTGKFS